MKRRILTGILQSVLVSIARMAGSKHVHLAIIQRVIPKYLLASAREATDARDLLQINEGAGRLNFEAMDVLRYQDRWL